MDQSLMHRVSVTVPHGLVGKTPSSQCVEALLDVVKSNLTCVEY